MGRKSLTATFSIVILIAVVLSSINSGTALGEGNLINVPSGIVLTDQKTYALGNGVTEFHVETNNAAGTAPVNSFIAQIDLTKNVTILANYNKYYNSTDPNKWTVSSWSRSRTSSQTKRYIEATGGNVLVATNGDFYNWNTGKPEGALVINGTTYHAASNRPYFAILDDGTPVIRDAGTPVTDDVMQAVGGSYMSIKDGQITPKAQGANVTLTPCNAIGIRGDGSVIIFMVDGRDDDVSVGYTLYDQARMLVSLGCVNALCLDCGGSSTFISKHKDSDSLEIRNNPSDGKERSVSSTLMIVATEKSLITKPMPTIAPTHVPPTSSATDKNDSNKNDANKNESNKNETNKNETNKNDANKNDANKNDTNKNNTDSSVNTSDKNNSSVSGNNTYQSILDALFSSSTAKKFKYGKNLYRVTSKKNKTVAFCGTVYNNPKKAIIPAKVKYQGKKYRVTSIDKKACMNSTSLKKIKIGKNILKIKNKAFFGCTSLKKVVGLENLGTISFDDFYKKYVLKEVITTEATTSTETTLLD
ncbi:MAG: hypothetical protein E7267_06200 [Lachnospiraceae bacterium]|nr:hypothetical protein [Lachnospiraceae bacterium]